MAVAIPEPPRSTPDLPKLNGMTSRTLMVTQHTSRSTAGRLVLTEQNVSVDRIIKLPNELVRQVGPGTFKFIVSDEGGPDKDEWTVKLGPDTPDVSAAPNGFGGSGFEAAGSPGFNGYSGAQIAPGWFYDEEHQLLIGPGQGNVRRWRPGESMPASMFGGPSSPAPGFGTAPGFGGGPSWGGPDPQVEALKEQLRLLREQQKEDEHRRTIAELQANFAKTMEAMTAKMEALSKPAAPAGPSQEVLELRAEVARLRDQGDAQRREDALRAEMRAAEERTQALVRELGKDDKNAPMMTLLTTMMQLQQSAQQDSAKATRETTAAMSASTQAQMQILAEKLSAFSMTPAQLMAIVNSKDSSAQLEMINSMMGAVRNVLDLQRDATGGGEMPAWVPVVQQGLDAVGKIGQAMALASAQKGGGVPRPALPRQQVPAPGQPPRVVAVPQAAPAGAPAAPAAPPPSPSAAARDAAAAKVFSRGAGASERDRVAAAAGMAPRAAAPAPGGDGKPLQRPPRRRPIPVPDASAAQPAPARAPITIVPPATELEPMPEPVVVDAEGGDEGEVRNYTPAELAKMGVDEVRGIAATFDDEAFFGPGVSSLAELRDAVAAEQMTPADIASALVQARQMFRGAGEYPPVMELLDANHFVVILERLLPAADEQFRGMVVVELARALAGEAGGVTTAA